MNLDSLPWKPALSTLIGDDQLTMKIRGAGIHDLVVSRGVDSLADVCSARKDKDVLLKSVTFLNLIKKFLSDSLPLTWRFEGCTIARATRVT